MERHERVDLWAGQEVKSHAQMGERLVHDLVLEKRALRTEYIPRHQPIKPLEREHTCGNGGGAR